MKFYVSFCFVLLFAISGFAQAASDKYLQTLEIRMSNNLYQSNIVSQNSEPTIRRHPPTESELENVKFSPVGSSVMDNQSISVSFKNLSNKQIKSVSFQLRITKNGKKVVQETFKSAPRMQQNGRIFISDRFFSDKDLSDNNSNLKREIIIKRIEFVDGTKLKF